MGDKARLRGLESLNTKDKEKLFSIMREIAEAEDEQESDGKKIAESSPKPWWVADD